MPRSGGAVISAIQFCCRKGMRFSIFLVYASCSTFCRYEKPSTCCRYTRLPMARAYCTVTSSDRYSEFPQEFSGLIERDGGAPEQLRINKFQPANVNLT